MLCTTMATQIGNAATLNMSVLDVYQKNASPCSSDGFNDIIVDGSLLYITSTRDDQFTVLNASDPTSITCYGNISDSAPPNSLDGTTLLSYDTVKKIITTDAQVDDALTMINMTDPKNPSFTNMGSTSNQSDGIWSLDNTFEPEYFNVGNQSFIMAAGPDDDVLVVFNVTDPRYIINLTYRITNSGTCTTDDIRYITQDFQRGILFAASSQDDYVLLYNTSQFLSATSASNITCMANYTDSDAAGTVDSPTRMYYDNITKLLYVTSYADNGFTILNTTNPYSLTVAGSFYNASTPAQATNSYRPMDIQALEKDGQRYVFIETAGNASALGNGYNARLTLYNATNLASITEIATYNDTVEGCIGIYGSTLEIDTVNEIVYHGSYNDNCFIARKIFNYEQTDFTAPNITNVKNESISYNKALINWTTSESSNSTVYYGTTTALGSTSKNTTSSTTNLVWLTGLTNNTVYYFNVSSCDSASNCNYSEQYNFTTYQVSFNVSNYTMIDTTNNIVFDYCTNTDSTLTWALGWLGTEKTGTNVTQNESIYYNCAPLSINDGPLVRFSFKINQSLDDINWINFKVDGYEGQGEVGTCYYANFSDSSWTSIADLPAADGTISVNLSKESGALNKVINGTGHAALMCYGPLFDAAEALLIDYVETTILYNYSYAATPATNTCTYSGAGDWIITDYCNITASVDVCPNKVIVDENGLLNITNYAVLTASMLSINYSAPTIWSLRFSGKQWGYKQC